jgi:hypothetical protein
MPDIGAPRVIAEYWFRKNDDGLWIEVRVDGYVHDRLGPFDTEAERQHVFDDLV